MRIYLKDLVAKQNLDHNSLVVDIGGYHGDYTQEVLNRFNCKVILFEPNPQAYSICLKRFRNDSRVMMDTVAVGSTIGERKLYLRSEGSSFFKNWAKTENYITVQEFPASILFKTIKADALKINCEGAEYEIIEDLNKYDMLKNFREILVQFHKTGGNAQESREILSKTHKCIYNLKWDLWVI